VTQIETTIIRAKIQDTCFNLDGIHGLFAIRLLSLWRRGVPHTIQSFVFSHSIDAARLHQGNNYCKPLWLPMANARTVRNRDRVVGSPVAHIT
jgi:hypothetical protein